MGCGEVCAKAIIIIINIFFFLIGVAFLAAGIIYFVGEALFSDALDKALESLSAAASNVTGSETTVAPDLDVGGILDIFTPLFIALIVVGIAMMITSILAMCGSCCSVNCMLITYVVIVLIIFAAHLALFIALMVGGFGSLIKTSLQKNIDEKFVGVGSIEPYSLGFNFIMSQYQCCGINSYQDFNSSMTWNRKPDSMRTENATTPVACCKTDPGEISEDYKCAYSPSDDYSNWKTGCWDIVNNELSNPNKNTFIGINCAVLGFELILAALALCVVFQSRKKEHY